MAVSTTEFVVRSDNTLVKRDISEYSVPAAAILQFFAGTEPFPVPMISPDTFARYNGKTSSGVPQITIARRIRSLPFRCRMGIGGVSAEGDIEYLPYFHRDVSESQDGELMSGLNTPDVFTFTPPADQILTLIISTVNSNSYLMAIDNTGNMFHPCLTNIYKDGRLCTGEAAVPAYRPALGLEAYINGFLTNWSNANWNGDLIGQVPSGGLVNTLKFSADTRMNIPNPNWAIASNRVRNGSDGYPSEIAIPSMAEYVAGCYAS